MVEVDPAGLAGHIGLPFVGVAQHGRPAGVVERGDPHGVDLGFVGDAQLALYLKFGGQPVGVPAEAALHLEAPHRAVPRDDVLDIAGEQVPVVRQAVGERRPVVKHVFRGPVTAGDGGAEGVVMEPVLEDLGFQGGEIRRAAAWVGAEVGARVGAVGHRSPVPYPHRHGDDDAHTARAPRYHPACRAHARPLIAGCDGPTRSVLLGRSGCSSEGSPVIAGSMPWIDSTEHRKSRSLQAVAWPQNYVCGQATAWSRDWSLPMGSIAPQALS